MMEFIKVEDGLKGLIADHGEENVREAATRLLGLASKSLPAEHTPVLSPEKIQDTLLQLDSAVSDVLKAGEELDEAYGERAELGKRRVQLETDVKLTEAEAIMLIEGEARSQYVVVGDKKVALNNDTARDAYRRMAAKPQREELAKINAELHSIEVNIEQAKEKRNTAKEANDSVRARANIQAALLNFLA